MHLDKEPEYVDVDMNIPEQDGLLFPINLNLQNLDELHLSAGGLWMSWLPCTELENSNAFLAAVTGIISGKFRILETIRNNKLVKSRLQYLKDDEWISIPRGLYTFTWPEFGRATYNVLRNTNGA